MTTFIPYTIEIKKVDVSGCGVYDSVGDYIEKREFETLKEARKEIRRMIKEEGFEKLGRDYWNREQGTELHLNF